MTGEGICPLCNKQYWTMKIHLLEEHKEIQFEKAPGTPIMCTLCGRTVGSYIYLITHYQRRHHEVLGQPPQEVLKTPIEQKSTDSAPFPLMYSLKVLHNQVERELQELRIRVSGYDEFFAQLGHIVGDVKTLNQERSTWKKRSKEWSARLIELQNILAKKED